MIDAIYHSTEMDYVIDGCDRSPTDDNTFTMRRYVYVDKTQVGYTEYKVTIEEKYVEERIEWIEKSY
jgi:hypothetical protein